MNNSDINNNSSSPQVQPQPQFQSQPQIPVQPVTQTQSQLQSQSQAQVNTASTVSTPITNSNEPTMISSDMFGSKVEINQVESSNSNNTLGSDNTNVILNDNLKKVEINYTPPSKLKIGVMLSLFVFIILFVIFLPKISNFINLYKSGNFNKKEEKITTGTLRCDLSKSDKQLTKIYAVTFSFTDSKLDKVKYVITTKGDPTADEQRLDALNQTCRELSQSLKNMDGVSIRCDYEEGKLIETQAFELASINVEALDNAFFEAGGNSPTYTYKQNIDNVQKNMYAYGYTCVREKPISK